VLRRFKELADKGNLSEDQIDRVLREWVIALTTRLPPAAANATRQFIPR
jgi:hypothetical protein